MVNLKNTKDSFERPVQISDKFNANN